MSAPRIFQKEFSILVKIGAFWYWDRGHGTVCKNASSQRLTVVKYSIVNMMEMVMKMGRKLVHKIKYGRTNYGRKASAIILGHPNPTSKRPSLWSFGAFTALPSAPPNDTNKNFTPSAGENTQVAINVPHSPD